MKKSILVLLAAIGLVSFKTIIQANYTITGNASGIKNGEKVILEKQDAAKGFVAVDSAKVENGKFTLNGNAIEPSIHFIKIGSSQEKIVFVLEKGNINVEVYKDS